MPSGSAVKEGLSWLRRKQEIASRRGRGYHRSGPTGLVPDRSGRPSLGEPASVYQSAFSMAGPSVIGADSLTSNLISDPKDAIRQVGPFRFLRGNSDHLAGVLDRSEPAPGPIVRISLKFTAALVSTSRFAHFSIANGSCVWELSDNEAGMSPTSRHRRTMRKLWLRYVKSALNFNLIFLTGIRAAPKIRPSPSCIRGHPEPAAEPG